MDTALINELLVNELKRISNRLHLIHSVLAIHLLKSYPHDKDVIATYKKLMSDLDEAENF